LFISTTLLCFVSSFAFGAYPNGYTYRKQIDITGDAGAAANYQVPLTVNCGVGDDAAGVAYLDSDATNCPYDIMFTDDDGTTELDFWREDGDDTAFWVEVADDLSSNQTIYLYYGKTQTLDEGNLETEKYGSNPVFTVGAGGQWDDFWAMFHSVVKSGGTYYAYYNGNGESDLSDTQIGLATSSDGITWSRSGSNPVVTPGAATEWDDTRVTSPCVWIEGSTWYMLYAGEGGDGEWKVGLATSSDGTTWTKDGSNPVLEGTAATWDAGGIVPGSAMLKESSTYSFFYWGYTDSGDYSTWKIGLATGTDLTSLSKSGSNPVLAGGGDDSWNVGVLEPFVVLEGSTYVMFYQGNETAANDRSSVGYATSSDKTTWTKNGTKLISQGDTAEWDDAWAETPIYVSEFSPPRIYYGGSEGIGSSPRIQEGYATVGVNHGDGGATFLFFDDFNNESLDTGKWTNTGSFSETGGTAWKEAGSTNTHHILVGKTAAAHPCVVETRSKQDSPITTWSQVILWDDVWADSGTLHGFDDGGDNWYAYQFPDATSDTDAGTVTNDQYYRIAGYINATTQKTFVDGVERCSISTTPPEASNVLTLDTSRGLGESGTPRTDFDFAFARKWTTTGTEPTVGTPGAASTNDTAIPFAFVTLSQLQTCLNDTDGTRYDIAERYYSGLGYTGTLLDMQLQYLSDQGCSTGTYLDRWNCALGTTPITIRDEIRSLCGN
jgi:hypothetical protein